MSELAEIAARLKRIEDRDEIRTLVAGYGRVVDDRDMDGLRALFTPDVTFGAIGAAQKIEGREAVVAYYESRYAEMPLSNHFTHDHTITLESDDLARGHVNAHVEVIRRGEPMVVAMRYADIYVRHEGAWKFQERITSFFYYMKAADYLEKLGERKRNFGSGEPVDADWPEGIATWQAYEKSV
jgi:uncharacterized protein (TIGR02246 family)